jgi:hypothetical protein
LNPSNIYTNEAKIFNKEVVPTQTHGTPLEQTIEVWNSKGNGYIMYLFRILLGD